ncbi:sugar O-acetyltransferase [Alkalibacterium olivapovliticus]|uniref:Maltose O-acetyltransferase n=1 Tax=Alkalibacterium olivapovliticus TaxID=99907 RepID=A0A2T0WB46_9LACT|nr:sugar O-acetyltransferase [Alkalibacterium olivapovliticus]PRY83935.1 maltose O-acetyltransferase [Alkalibacterium olivapovliticus]
MISNKNKMIAGELYDPIDPQLLEERKRGHDTAERFNRADSDDERKGIIKTLFGSTGQNITVEPALRVDYGYNIHVGENFYANFNCVFLDVCPITIGDNAMLGPGVSIVTAEHPLPSEERNSGMEFGRAITIGDNCWVGTHATIVGGVTLGNNCVVAAGAVVTESFSDNVVIGGVPARIIKRIE